jgi:hypothetical protein
MTLSLLYAHKLVLLLYALLDTYRIACQDITIILMPNLIM